jgi:hypothetical protein
MIEKVFQLFCDCRNESLRFGYWDDGTIFVSHYTQSFYAYQRPVYNRIKTMFKEIWNAITGKEYLHYELVIDKDRLQDFKEFVAEL